MNDDVIITKDEGGSLKEFIEINFSTQSETILI